LPSGVARLDRWRTGDQSLLIDTAFRGLLGTALFALAPFVSDVYRLWRRSAGLVPGGFSPGQFEYPPLSALYWAPFPRFPSATWAVVANGLVMTLFAVGVTWLLVYAKRSGLSPDIRLWAASPALIFFLPIGWDAAVALFALAGVILVGVRRFRLAGAALTLGAVFKIFPGAAILPLLPLIPGSKARRGFMATGVVVVVVAYLVYAISRPQTWFLHIEFASSRDYTRTVWWPIDLGLRKMGIQLSNETIGLLATAAFLTALVGLTWWVSKNRPTAAEAALLAILIFLLLNKVLNPQYLLWVLPLMALVGAPRGLARVVVYAALVQLAHVYLPISDVLATAAFIVVTVGLVALGVIVMTRPAAVPPAAEDVGLSVG
jgi:hypothetical protein